MLGQLQNRKCDIPLGGTSRFLPSVGLEERREAESLYLPYSSDLGWPWGQGLEWLEERSKLQASSALGRVGPEEGNAGRAPHLMLKTCPDKGAWKGSICISPRYFGPLPFLTGLESLLASRQLW